MPAISVIVPVYKVEKYLNACVDSILNQTFEDYELVLVDDGSPDRCGEVCDEYASKDRRIKVIHQANAGLSAARNAGIARAAGGWITFIDSDDIVAEDYLRTLYQMHEKYDAEVVVCEAGRFRDGDDWQPVIEPDEAKSYTGREAVRALYSSDKEEKIPIIACGKLYFRELFDGVRFPVGKMHEDDATVPYLLYKAGKVVWKKDKLYGYRQREDSIMNRTFSIRRYDGLEALENCMAFFRKKGETDICNGIERFRMEAIAINSLMAHKYHLYRDVPEKYRMSRFEAIRYLKKNLPYDLYEYWVAKIYPGLILFEARIRKVKTMLGLKNRQ